MAAHYNNFDPVASHIRDHFGLAIHPDDVGNTHGYMPHERNILPALTGYYRPWIIPRREDRPRNTAHIAKDGTFQVCVDVHHFKPSEIHVKTLNNVIFIEGEHQEREDDHGSVERRFARKYSLPDAFNSDDVVSTLSSDGVLSIRCPPKPSAQTDSHRTVAIHHTGPAHLTVKEAKEVGKQHVEK